MMTGYFIRLDRFGYISPRILNLEVPLVLLDDRGSPLETDHKKILSKVVMKLTRLINRIILSGKKFSTCQNTRKPRKYEVSDT